MTVNKPYLSTVEAADLLNTTAGVLANWRHHGEGPPYIKLRRKILYAVKDIQEWLDYHKVKTAYHASPFMEQKGGSPEASSRDRYMTKRIP